MIKMTSAYANKLLKQLDEDKVSRGTLRAEKTADYFRRLRLQQRAVSEETARLCRK